MKGGQFARDVVDNAQRAEGVAAGVDQWRARVEAHVLRAGCEWIAFKARIQHGIGHHERLVLQNGVCTERQFTRCLPHGQAMVRLEPLSVCVDEAHQGDRRPADRGRDGSEIVERLFRVGVENCVSSQGLKALGFINWQWCLDHERVASGASCVAKRMVARGSMTSSRLAVHARRSTRDDLQTKTATVGIAEISQRIGTARQMVRLHAGCVRSRVQFCCATSYADERGARLATKDA